MDLSFMHNVVTLFQQHQPWIGDKVGGALITQSLKELWEQAKAKLGSAATEKIEAKPDDAGQWEVFKAKLLVALDDDPAFREKMCELTAQSQQEVTAAISQRASGPNNTQVAVDHSQVVNIRVK
jgi:hypothetical protein